MQCMHVTTHLVTVVDLDCRTANEMHLSAVHFAVLANGRRMTLLDDRGWSASGLHIWHWTSVQEIQETARVVVGPDYGNGEHSRADMAADHWAGVAATLRRHGVHTDAEDLSGLPHDVELSERFRSRLTP